MLNLFEMKNIEKFLFVYSLLITTAVLFAAILFAPKPSNFMIILFLVPVVYYFWLKMVADDINKKSMTTKSKESYSLVSSKGILKPQNLNKIVMVPCHNSLSQ